MRKFGLAYRISCHLRLCGFRDLRDPKPRIPNKASQLVRLTSRVSVVTSANVTALAALVCVGCRALGFLACGG